MRWVLRYGCYSSKTIFCVPQWGVTLMTDLGEIEL